MSEDTTTPEVDETVEAPVLDDSIELDDELELDFDFENEELEEEVE
jgi:hypothetical protein